MDRGEVGGAWDVGVRGGVAFEESGGEVLELGDLAAVRVVLEAAVPDVRREGLPEIVVPPVLDQPTGIESRSSEQKVSPRFPRCVLKCTQY